MNLGQRNKPLKDCDAFLTQWAEMNLAVGAFFDGAGYQTDQQNLNWALVSMDGVHVLRCERFNIGYWNIHERDLRFHEIDGSTSFTVGHSPLGFFHFSGYDISDPLTFSQHDRRHSVYNLPAVATLLSWYSNEVSLDSSAYLINAEYRFDLLPNGFALNKSIRQSLKRYESFIPRFDVRTVLGSQALCAFLMDPLPATKSLLPFVFADLLNHRPDLIPLCPDAHTSANPQGFWNWLVRHGASEHGIGIDFLLDRHRRLLISASMRDLYAKVIQLVLVAQLKFLGDDRVDAGELLLQAGHPGLASEHIEGKWEWRFTSDLDAILRIYTERDDLRTAFPDVFGRDREAFTKWLLEHGRKEHGLPKAFVERFKKADLNRSLSGIFSYVCRQSFIWDTARNHLLDDNIDPFLREILRDAGENLEYDLDDVVILRFVHATGRHVLVPFYLEMPFIRREDGASRSAKRNSMFLPGHIRDQGWARKGCADHAAMFDVVDSAIEDEVRAWGAKTLGSTSDVLDFLRGPKTIGSAIRWVEPLARRTALKLRTQGCDVGDIEDRLIRRMKTPGVNVFGYFASDIGVGESSRGLACAIDFIREVRRVPFYTAQMQPGVGLRDLVQEFDHLTDTNVFVTYPHQREDMLSRLRPEQTAGRRNIAHLAWEQKDANPWWEHVYDRYDEIWTISEFAATPFRKMFPNRVRVAPNVLDFDSFPAVERPERLQGDQVNFLFVFDAASSIERKNPEGVIKAFVKAFADTQYKDRVKLTLKIGGLHTPYHFTRINRLRQQANSSGLNIDFDGRELSRDGILRLIASADCYISLHRSEGFGYTLAEAMYYGIPVVATGYSGNLDYMDESNSYLVPTREVFVQVPDGPFQRGSIWGDPDIDQAADILRHIMDHPGDAIEVGAKGAASVKDKLSARTVANHLRDAFDGPRAIAETAKES
jgi:glycosyltransferase involved in cell wall biosynthesis